MKFMSFDLEIAKQLPEGETDWNRHRPLGITCAAVAYDGGVEVYSSGDREPMKPSALKWLINRLQIAHDQGHTIVGWNSLQFDFDVLAESTESSSSFEDCCRLALDHLDLMFLFFCHRGHFLGLDAAARGAGLPGKPEGISGAKAPELWAAGDFDTVLSYLRNDVQMTLALAQEIEKNGFYRWTSRAGKPNTISIDQLLTVEEANQLPMPDTAWMTDPYPRSRFFDWMQADEPRGQRNTAVPGEPPDDIDIDPPPDSAAWEDQR